MFDDHDEEVLGEPSFELRLRDGVPQVSGCYFMHPVLQVTEVGWDESTPSRILVTANDGTSWYADNVSRTESANVVLSPVEGNSGS